MGLKLQNRFFFSVKKRLTFDMKSTKISKKNTKFETENYC